MATLHGRGAVGTGNPFTPGFGRSPRHLAGRQRLLEDIYEGLDGVAASGFSRLLLGERGTGKTVLVNTVEQAAAEAGWVVLRCDAGTPGLLGRIMEAIDWAVEDPNDRALKDLRHSSRARLSSLTIMGFGAAWTQKTSRREANSTSLQKQLRLLAEAAQEAGTKVLLTVDEFHAVDRLEARRLGNDLQIIAERSELPLAFLGAGLPWLQNTLMKDRKLTFLHRCTKNNIDEITYADAMRCLRMSILEAGGSIETEALRLAAEVSAGRFPYKLQMIGYDMWQISGSPSRMIDPHDAEEAIRQSNLSFIKDISRPAWEDLPVTDQLYLSALADAGGRARRKQIAARSDAGSSSLSTSERRLQLGGYISRTNDIVSLTNLVPMSVIIEDKHLKSQYSKGDTTEHPLRANCAKWMPRAKTNCVLPPGHAGRCRSRRW